MLGPDKELSALRHDIIVQGAAYQCSVSGVISLGYPGAP